MGNKVLGRMIGACAWVPREKLEIKLFQVGLWFRHLSINNLNYASCDSYLKWISNNFPRRLIRIFSIVDRFSIRARIESSSECSLLELLWNLLPYPHKCSLPCLTQNLSWSLIMLRNLMRLEQWSMVGWEKVSLLVFHVKSLMWENFVWCS